MLSLTWKADEPGAAKDFQEATVAGFLLSIKAPEWPRSLLPVVVSRSCERIRSRTGAAEGSHGAAPFHNHNSVTAPEVKERGLALYLDVSGSVNDDLPRILGVMRGLRRELKTVYLFSTKVVERPFKTLLAGHVDTTLGTSFDCVAQSILDQGLDKAAVFTDGYASLQHDLQKQLQERHVRVLTVLFGGRSDCAAFAPLGDVIQLDDVCG